MLFSILTGIMKLTWHHLNICFINARYIVFFLIFKQIFHFKKLYFIKCAVKDFDFEQISEWIREIKGKKESAPTNSMDHRILHINLRYKDYPKELGEENAKKYEMAKKKAEANPWLCFDCSHGRDNRVLQRMFTEELSVKPKLYSFI